MNGLRVAFVGGLLSYRALFDWLSPPLFVAAMLATPAFQVVFFASFGEAYSTRPAEFFALGNAVQACAMAGVYGVAQTLANERSFGTIGHVLLSPANRMALYLGRSLPHVLAGMVTSLTGLGLAVLVTDVTVDPARLGPLLLVLLVTSAGCAALGIPLGALGLLNRDTVVGSSVAYFGLLLVSGASVPAERLPTALRVLGGWLPVGNGVSALRRLFGHGPDGVFTMYLVREALLGVAAMALGMVVLKYVERRSRHRGDLDLF